METGQFMDLISVHYTKIKSLFISRLNKLELEFNNDIFNDTFIKCAQKFNNDIITYDTAIKYFWVAYINTLKNEISIQNNICEFVENFDEEIHDCIDIQENSRACYIYNIIMSEISKKFGDNDMNIYSLYMYHGWSIDELIKSGYDCTDFENKIKKIHKFSKSYGKTHFK